MDDLRLDLFLRSFPQLLTTHHVIHCHYVGVSGTVNERECEYEWIETDSSLMEIVDRFMAEHDGSTNDIALKFQIRPRSDTKSDGIRSSFFYSLSLSLSLCVDPLAVSMASILLSVLLTMIRKSGYRRTLSCDPKHTEKDSIDRFHLSFKTKFQSR